MSASVAIRPAPSRAAADLPPGYTNGCHLDQSRTTPRGCVYGDKRAKRTITLVGDSKARQWLPTLDRYGKAAKWRIVAHTKSACPFTQAAVPQARTGRRYVSCARWNDRVLSRLRRDRPRVVVVALYAKYALASRTATTTEQRQAAMAQGMRASWRSVTKGGSELVVLNSTPYIGMPYRRHPTWLASACVAAHRTRTGLCDVPAAKALSGPAVWTPQDRDRVLTGLDDVHLIDLNPRLCSSRTCRVVLGHVLVYRDTHHLTATVARRLYPYLRNRLTPLLSQRSRQASSASS
ncbi:SGNH hydrolase domain-containing protein [Aeromicrobium wangtongii]|uniref:SGNH hydrolase domain-containing protein n=1 Tax=Aeromicrobium wangtongii TaxID=2969247 RepID=UPI002016AC95|nr:SGNH hydrolase domain-containing protein [Aeromicrobium wangtongii]MCL3817081.1 hypothetical protein [Aeromicrobium wangtongii]